MSHHIHVHRRFGRRLFALLLIAAVVLALVYLIRRNNLKKAGLQPKPFLEDVRGLYGQLLSRFDRGDLSGVIDEVLGKSPAAA